MISQLAASIFDRYLRGKPHARVAIGVTDGAGHGFASLAGREADASDNDNALYEIGSISKTFAAALLEKAALSGMVSLDTPLSDTMPTMQLTEGNERQATLGQLASHVSGLPYEFPRSTLKRSLAEGRDPWALLTRKDLLRYVARCKMGRPGRRYVYSNVGYAVLAVALENVWGQPYASLVQHHLFTPLQMTSSISSGELVDGVIEGYRGRKPAPFSESELLFGPGDVRSTAADLLRYVDGALDEDRAPYAGFGSLQFSQRVAVRGQKFHSGLAWGLADTGKGDVHVLASGATSGFSAFCTFSKKRKKGIVALSNYLDIANAADLVKALLSRGRSTIGNGAVRMFDKWLEHDEPT